MSFSPIKGIVAAAITPVKADFSIDHERLTAHVRGLLNQGCSHISCFGTTGEGASFSTAQKIAALYAFKDAGLDMARHIPGVMTTTLEDAVTMVEAAHALGCRAALVLPPFYYAPDDEGIAAFFDALVARTRKSAPIDLVLYNIPQMSGIRFSIPLVETVLARHGDRIVGLKDSTGDLENGLALVKHFPQLAVLTGDDRVLPKLVAAGGAGMIGGLPNLCTRELVALYDAPEGPDAEALCATQARRIAAVNDHGALVALKTLLAHYRDDSDYARVVPPLVPLGADGARAVVAAFAATGFDFAGRV